MPEIEFTSSLAIATVLLSLRLAPVFSFAPPFTLLKTPLILRVLLGVSISFWAVLTYPELTIDRVPTGGAILFVIMSELLFGIILALPLQWAGAAIYMTGRAVDIQAGFGLALLADPTTRSQIPLMGTILIYCAGVIFFAIGGGQDLLIIFNESLKRIPLGAFTGPDGFQTLIMYISIVLSMAIGLIGMTLLTLFLIDMTVAFLSRTLPQMNVLLIGFQVKTMAVLLTLPIACLLYTSPSPRDATLSRMPSSA